MKKIIIQVTSFIFLNIGQLQGQSSWNIQITQSSIDCPNEQVCYQLELQNAGVGSWALADQNYRLFFDGDLMTVTSVISLLPNTFYSTANIDQNIKITGQGQEAASPLDDIDDNLGFLDFSTVQTDKSNPSAAIQLSNDSWTPVAQICVEVAVADINTIGTDCLSFYHSRPSTAGNITNQYSVISENNAPNSTTAATGVGYKDLINDAGADACFNTFCGNAEPCTFYAYVSQSNCCKACTSGNLQVKTLHWMEEYANISSLNIALGKNSVINGVLKPNSGNSHQATDGKFEGEPFGFYDYAFSEIGVDNRWDIDLIGLYDLEVIKVFTKTGCCQTPTNYRIFISELPFYDNSLTVLLNDATIQNYSIPVMSGSTPSTLNLNNAGRFVRIYLEGNGQMQLVEVEIIGSGNANSNPYEYNWSDANIGNIPNPDCLAPGTYEVTIVDTATGCTAVKSAIVD